MNQIALVDRTGNPQFDVFIDRRRLQEHFVGPQGAHPPQVFALGWKGAQVASQKDELDRFLVRRNSALISGRISIPVCEECGDVGCGAIAARIERSGWGLNFIYSVLRIRR
jgi:hypothetical protein